MLRPWRPGGGRPGPAGMLADFLASATLDRTGPGHPMQLSRFPRIRLGHLPTPLDPLPRVSALLNRPEIWIKQDGCTGLSTWQQDTQAGIRDGRAMTRDADIVLPQRATLSNPARQTDAAAAKLRLDCHIRLQDRTGYGAPNYRLNGKRQFCRTRPRAARARRG